ncbi:MAG: helix-turn-helix transcriptional regulator [Acidobacteriota bacterium]|nr:helix-turn-helix transcriptional regulator [Acidobacteriota bacterium]
MSQLDLALEAEISTRHLSFVETGRSQPSREMILRLADQLELPLRERNVLLTSAGFAPVFPERPLNGESLTAARKTVDLILRGFEPNPALALDRHWNLIAANKAVDFLLKGVNASLLEPPVNVLRLSLHPEGLAPQIINFAEWRNHLLERLSRQIEITADSVLAELELELKSYPMPQNAEKNQRIGKIESSDIAIPFRLLTDGTELSFLSTTTVFGTPIEVTLSELAIESFFPADVATADYLYREN